MNETNELPRNIPKVRVLSEIEKEEALALEKTENRDGIKVKFNEACESGLIKPGMIVRFKNPTFGPIFLDKERTGCKEDQNYEGKIEDGIVVKIEDKYCVITVLIGKKELSLYGRFGCVYCDEILREVQEKALKHYFSENSVIDRLSDKLLTYLYNDSFINQYYLEQYLNESFIESSKNNSERKGFIRSSFFGTCYIDASYKSSNKSVNGNLILCIEPLDTTTYLKSLAKHKGNSHYTYKCQQFSFYVEF